MLQKVFNDIVLEIVIMITNNTLTTDTARKKKNHVEWRSIIIEADYFFFLSQSSNSEWNKNILLSTYSNFVFFACINHF